MNDRVSFLIAGSRTGLLHRCGSAVFYVADAQADPEPEIDKYTYQMESGL